LTDLTDHIEREDATTRVAAISPATSCNKLQQAATHCSTLQHTATNTELADDVEQATVPLLTPVNLT